MRTAVFWSANSLPLFLNSSSPPHPFSTFCEVNDVLCTVSATPRTLLHGYSVDALSERRQQNCKSAETRETKAATEVWAETLADVGVTTRHV